MVDFSNITAQGVQPGATREYTFDRIGGEPSVVLAPMHDENPAYLDERLRLATERAAAMAAEPRRKGGSGAITSESIKKNMEEDRDYECQLLATACIKSWGESAPVDASGKAVKFSPENALSFLRALPIFMLDAFRAYAGNIYNFMDRPKRDPELANRTGE